MLPCSQAIHETCVIHRDIKPANIFMCPENVVKVGDLGVAKALTKAHYAQTTIGELNASLQGTSADSTPAGDMTVAVTLQALQPCCTSSV